MKALHFLFVFLVVCSTAGFVKAQERELFHRNDLTLIILSNDTLLNVEIRQRMAQIFFLVYPAMMKQYNLDAVTQITFNLDTCYHGVAAADATTANVWFDPEWLSQHPEDIDVVTHELMHLVQAYPQDAGPDWLIEGIADYGRFRFGVNNEKAGWKPTGYQSDQCYCDSYRVTANFLLWIEAHFKGDLVNCLNDALRKNLYADSIWKTQTGRDLETLWKLYGKSSQTSGTP